MEKESKELDPISKASLELGLPPNDPLVIAKVIDSFIPQIQSLQSKLKELRAKTFRVSTVAGNQKLEIAQLEKENEELKEENIKLKELNENENKI